MFSKDIDCTEDHQQGATKYQDETIPKRLTSHNNFPPSPNYD